MTETRTTVTQYSPRCGWANRLLRIDLSERTISAEPLDEYVPDYIGARGIAARIMWNEYPEPVGAFAPENPLIVVAGALAGTRSPYSGRAEITAFSPQAYPYNWYTRANIGSQFAAELKRAGYDGLVVTGASDTPVQVVIRDDQVSILEAEDLWGLDTFDTIAAVHERVGKGARLLTIGPAGERLSRIATIHTASSSAAGQGGFGAVMGSKKLKAISVVGTGRVRVAEPEAFDALVKATNKELRANRGVRGLDRVNERLSAERGGRARPYACTASCPTPCNLYYTDMPGVAYPDRTYEGHMACVGGCFQGLGEDGPISHGGLFDWKLGLYGGFEMNVLTNRYGLNQWDVALSMVPWLGRSQREGLISHLNGVPMDWQDASFWAEFLHAIAYREGQGDALAEGALRAASILGVGEDIVRRYYNGWGFGGHWDGHACWGNHLVFPYWIVSALQWSTDTRDPYSSSHGYVQNIMRWAPFDSRFGHDITWDQIRAIGERVYGSADALDPHRGYSQKAYPAYYHDKRSVMKDSVPTDDQVFPLIYSDSTEDRFFRVGDIDGPSIDHRLFTLGTGTAWSEEEFERAAERVYALERAICVRHWGRNRAMDESVITAYEYEENWTNPVLGEKYALDRTQFLPVMDEYYGHLGWDPKTGWPTRERLAELGIEAVHAPMVAGAERAREVTPEWPETTPIPA